MARVASCRQTCELPGRGLLVALVAFHQRVRPHQRKAILMIANRVQGNIPSLDRVATLAVGAKLPPMNIRMAIRATCADVFEDQFGVALRAAHLAVHAPQWITRLVVIEIRIGANRPPTGCGVAVLAGNGDRAMRVRDLCLRCSRCLLGAARRLLRTHDRQQRQGHDDSSNVFA